MLVLDCDLPDRSAAAAKGRNTQRTVARGQVITPAPPDFKFARIGSRKLGAKVVEANVRAAYGRGRDRDLRRHIAVLYIAGSDTHSAPERRVIGHELVNEFALRIEDADVRTAPRPRPGDDRGV